MGLRLIWLRIALAVLLVLLLLAWLLGLFGTSYEVEVDAVVTEEPAPTPDVAVTEEVPAPAEEVIAPASGLATDEVPAEGADVSVVGEDTVQGEPPGGGGGEGMSDSASVTDLLREQLKEADVAFNAPDELDFGKTAQIRLALSPMGLSVEPEDLLSPDLPGDIETHPAEYARKTQATLSGPDFKIDPSGPQVRTILEGRPTVWTWTVVPAAFGPDKRLTLTIDAILTLDGQDMPPTFVRTLDATIRVRVGVWGWLTHQAGEITAVHGALGAVGATAVAGLAFLGRRLRQPEKRRPVGFRPLGRSDD